MKNLGEMMKQAQKMQADMVRMQEKLGAIEVAGASGGGMVSIVLNGKGEMKKITLDPQAVDSDDVEMLEDLILAAHNDARRKVEQTTAEHMKRVAGGLALPPGVTPPF